MFDAGDAVLGDFFEKTFDDSGRGVVGVDQHGEVLMLAGGGGFAGHAASLRRGMPDLTANTGAAPYRLWSKLQQMRGAQLLTSRARSRGVTARLSSRR